MLEIPEIPNLIHYAIPFFVILIVVEIIVTSKRKMEAYEFKDAAASITMGLGNVFINFIFKALILLLITVIYQNFRLFTIPFTWWAWILVFLADDFSYYWMHRISHENRFFWASHVVHHSSKRYNLSTALRQTWTGLFSVIFWLWMALIGFHPLMILTQMSISLLYQFWIRTETIDKMPKWFEAIFNTPSHHRVHHATNPQYLDRNHAGILIIWDKLFGTFEPEKEKPVYGLIANIDTYNPITIAFKEWANLFSDFFTSKTSLANKFKYFLKPPGWKHDGTGILSEDLRKEWEKKL
jgi:sterol desaturase/sphingolipid hydroxylase (fatty acid hydroxylase superfamily)